jgi:hypothetical protein
VVASKAATRLKDPAAISRSNPVAIHLSQQVLHHSPLRAIHLSQQVLHHSPLRAIRPSRLLAIRPSRLRAIRPSRRAILRRAATALRVPLRRSHPRADIRLNSQAGLDLRGPQVRVNPARKAL